MLIFLKMNLAIISLVGNDLRMEVSMSDVVNNVICLCSHEIFVALNKSADRFG